MAGARLKDLPSPPPGKHGWPWTEESGDPPQEFPAQDWPRITLVTPSFNQAQFIEETIRSILLQGYPNLEYLVLDGGSSDGSVDIIKKYSRWMDFWRSEPDGGQSAAIDWGLRSGTGRYASWINSDDFLCKNALLFQARCIVQRTVEHPEASELFAGICRFVDADGNLISEHQGKIHTLEDLLDVEHIWRADGHIIQPEVLFPRQLALAIGGLNRENHYTMDFELWGRFLLSGASFHYTEVPFATFRSHPAQKTSERVVQTSTMIDAAKRLLAAAPYSEDTKAALSRKLDAYFDDYQTKHWESTGRLARLGLPRTIVDRLRELSKLIAKNDIERAG